MRWFVGPFRKGVLLLVLGLLSVAAGPIRADAARHPLAEFFRATNERTSDRRDALADGFNPARLPLVMAALASDSSLVAPSLPSAYAAAARWHFWTGARWDTRGAGVWTIDPGTVPVGSAYRNRTLIGHAALELIQLAALARLAERTGELFDALVWWDDRARLAHRLTQQTYDARAGAHVDLDSTGARTDVPAPSSAIALAAGLPAVPARARSAARVTWTGRPPDAPWEELTSEDRLHALDVARSFLGWGGDAGLRVLEPEVSSALIAAGIDELDDPLLSGLVADALTGAGLAPRPTVPVRLGTWTGTVHVDGLAPRPFERARIAVHVLDRFGVFDDPTTERLPALVDSLVADGTEDARSELGDILAVQLSAWRTEDPRASRSLWERRRYRRDALSGDSAAFRWRGDDLALWLDRALDLVAEDVIRHHLRKRRTSRWRAALEPTVAGRGDPTQLVVTPPADAVASDMPARVGVLWTDGRTVLPAVAAELRPAGSLWTADLGAAPTDDGLWFAVVEGLPDAVRVAPSVAVVEPLRFRVLPLQRRGRALTYRVDVTSQVAETVSARIDLTAPLSFDVIPGRAHEMGIAPGGTSSWEVVIRPGDAVDPSLHEITFEVSDQKRSIARAVIEAAVPLQWLRLGPLPIADGETLDRAHAPDETVDLAQRFRGVMRTVGWNRLPSGRIDATGWIELADAEAPRGVHYVFTAFSTGSRESVLRLEARGPAIARVNGATVARTPTWGGRVEAEARFVSGTNFVLVKTLASGHGPADVRVSFEDIDGQPLRGVENSLERLLDQYAYLTRTRDQSDERTLDRESMRLVPFTFRAPAAATVAVVGSFNGWSPTATPMTRLDDGRWQAKVRLRPGRFEYKFAVDRGDWVPDPANPDAVADGFGGRNSVLVVD